MTHPITTRAVREVDARTNDGITTRLLWHPADDSLTLELVSPDSAFQVTVAASEALDAFNHPFAYAAYHGIPYSPGREPASAASRTVGLT